MEGGAKRRWHERSNRGKHFDDALRVQLPNSSSVPGRSQQAAEAGLIPSLEPTTLAARDLRATFARLLVGVRFMVLFSQNTHRLATNLAPHRCDDLERLSREAMCLGRLTNRSDVGDHASTIRLSRGPGQRVEGGFAGTTVKEHTP